MTRLVKEEVESGGKRKRAGCRSPKEKSTHDLDPNSSVYIIVDSISKNGQEIGERLPARGVELYLSHFSLNTALVLWQLTYLPVASCRPSLSATSPLRCPHLLCRQGDCAGTALDRDSGYLLTCALSKRPLYLSTCESGPPLKGLTHKIGPPSTC